MTLKILTLALLLATPACSGLYVYETSSAGRYGGSPPPAPADGYRHRQANGVMLEYNAGLGLYVVQGYPGHYYKGGQYYRSSGSTWQTSTRLRGGWRSIPQSDLPPGLRR